METTKQGDLGATGSCSQQVLASPTSSPGETLDGEKKTNISFLWPLNWMLLNQNKVPKELTPQIFITKPALNDIFIEVANHPDEETSWGIYGLRFPDESVIICGVIKPREINRFLATTSFGSDDYAEEVRWLKANYFYMCQQTTPKPQAKLQFLFKGHSHHRLGVRNYSFTDVQSIQDAMRMGMDCAIGPLANIDKEGWVIKESNEPGTLNVTWYQKISVHFYCMTKKLVEAGYDIPVLVTPEVLEDVKIPLPPSCWIFTNRRRYEKELELLRSHGCKVDVSWVLNGKLPLKVLFKISKIGWSRVLNVYTNFDYPRSEPKITLDGQEKWYMGWHLYHLQQESTILETVKRLERAGTLHGPV